MRGDEEPMKKDLDLKLVRNDEPANVRAVMLSLGQAARKAAHQLALAPADAKNKALLVAAGEIRQRASQILAANARDVAEARAHGLTDAFLERLTLDAKHVEGMAKGLEEIAALPDPVGRVLARFERPNGLVIERVATPLGVIGVIFESRPGGRRRRRRALPQGRQCGDPARRLGELSFRRADP